MKKVKLFCKATLVLVTMLLLGGGNVWADTNISVPNGDFSEGTNNATTFPNWTVYTSGAQYKSTKAIEAYNTNFDFYQTLTDLENGLYKVTVKGFYRNGTGGVTNDNQLAILYADGGHEVSIPIAKINQYSLNGNNKPNNNSWTEFKVDGTKVHFFVPNDINAADYTIHTANLYDNTLYVWVSNGTLKIGAKKTTAVTNDWCYLDDFTVTKMDADFASTQWGWQEEALTNNTKYYIRNMKYGTYLNLTDQTVSSIADAAWFQYDGTKFQNVNSKYIYPYGNSGFTNSSNTDGKTQHKWNNKLYYIYYQSGITWEALAVKDDGWLQHVSSGKVDPASTWYFYSESQKNAYDTYNSAYNALSSYVSAQSLPVGYKPIVYAALASNSYANKNDATTKTNNLTSAKTVAEGVHSAYANALVTVADVKNILDNAAASDAKNVLQNAYNEYSAAIENAADQKTVEDADSALKDARDTYYASAKKIPNFVANFTQEAANALLVEDAIENAFSLTDVDGETYTFIPEGVVAYDKATNTLTALAAGTTVLTIDQPATSTIEAGSAEFSFTVSKHDVVWSWNAGNVAYIYNTTIDNIFTLSAGNLANITISTSTNENVAKLVNGNLVIGKVAGTAQFTVTAVADNKWNAKEETFTVTPGHVANHVPYVPTEALFNNSIYKSKDYISWTGGENNEIKLGSNVYADKYIVIAISGIPDKLHIGFDAGGACTGTDWYVYESETNDFSGKSNLVSGIGNSNTSRDITLNHTTRFIKIGNGKNGNSYIKNLSITELKALSADTPEAIMTKLGDTESASADVVLTYANAGLTINASVTGEEGFSIDKTSVEGGIDVYGEETFVVSFDPTGKAAGEHSATVTFTDGDMRKEVTVTAHVLVPLSLVAMNNEDGTDYYYATFSNADYAVEFVEDVEVYTVSVDGDRMNLNPVSSHQVPANAGVLIKSKKNNILYKYISSAADLSNNMLLPGTGAETTSDVECRFYRLAYYDYDAKTGLGFYYGPNCNDGQAFKCKVGTAYLAVPRTVAAPARFLLGRQDVSTDLLNVNVNDNQGKKVMMNGVLYIIRDGKTYDCFGRMVK